MTELDGRIQNQPRLVAELDYYKAAVHKCAVDHGWWEDGERNMGEMLMLMTSELAEALEEYRDNKPYLYFKADVPWMIGEQNWEGPGSLVNPLTGEEVLGKPEGLAAEFADVIIRIFDT